MFYVCEKVQYLRLAQLFSDLSDEELNAISARVSLREFQKHEIILFEEDTNRYMYSVLEGEVKVFYTSEDGKESIVAFHGKGESFGEVSLIDQLTIPATVAAVEKSVLLIIERKEFFKIIYDQPKVMNKLLCLLTGRLRSSWNQVRMLHFKDASFRVMLSIKELSAERGIPVPEGVELNLKLTHQNLADMTGLTRETVTRVLDKLKKMDMLSIQENRCMLIKHKFFQENSHL